MGFNPPFLHHIEHSVLHNFHKSQLKQMSDRKKEFCVFADSRLLADKFFSFQYEIYPN